MSIIDCSESQVVYTFDDNILNLESYFPYKTDFYNVVERLWENKKSVIFRTNADLNRIDYHIREKIHTILFLNVINNNRYTKSGQIDKRYRNVPATHMLYMFTRTLTRHGAEFVQVSKQEITRELALHIFGAGFRRVYVI